LNGGCDKAAAQHVLLQIGFDELGFDEPVAERFFAAARLLPCRELRGRFRRRTARS
jgi:hypothetical protein